MRRIGTVRLFALLCAVCLPVFLGCRLAVPAPAAGAPEYQEVGWVAVPFGRASVFGGNLQIARRDLDIDTRVGNVALGAVWNSADARWRYAFEATWDGATFVDASGAVHDAAAVPNGQALPGTIWVRVDARTLRTKGGLVHEFDAQGNLAAVRFASGAHPRLEYRRAVVAGAPRVVELRQLAEPGAGTRFASFGYDGAGRLVSIEDRAGRTARLAWDAAGRLVAARDAFDVAAGLPGFRYAYGPDGLAVVTSSEGVRAEYAYTTERRIASARAIGAGSPATTFAYESLGRRFRTTVTDALGAAAAYEWESSRRLLAATNAAGERSEWTWSGLRPASETQPDGVVTRWEWSGDDLAIERQPSGNVVAFAWHPSGEDRQRPDRRALRRAADSIGLIAERAYDGAGRPIRVTNGAGESITLAWSGANLLASATDAAGIETRLREYGEHGHPRRVERGESSETREYDAVGNLRFGTGNAALPGAGDTGVVSRTYDADRNLASVVLAGVDGGSAGPERNLVVTRRSDGQPVHIERPEGGDSEFVYDALGRAVERRDRSGGAWRTTRFVPDPLGRIASSERPNGMRTATTWDAVGRRRTVTHFRGAAADSGARLSYERGRLVSVADDAHGGALETYAYDAAGRPSAVRYPGGERLELSYDLRSRVVEERYFAASGGELRRLRFSYDLADRETEVRDGTVPLRTIVRASGRVAQERFANGLARTYAYGAADGLLKTATMQDAAGTVVERTRLEKTGTFSIAWHSSTETTGAIVRTSHEHFTLGPIGDGQPGERVVAWGSTAAGDVTVPHDYDALGNLVRVGDPDAPTRTFQLDAERSRLLRVRRGSGAILHEYAYDEAGFVVARDGAALEWDGAGRAIAVGSARFRWDALDRLVSASVDGSSQRRLFGGRVRADAGGSAIAIDLGALTLDLLGNHRFRHLDFRGNVKLVSDAQGRIVFHARYGPYGPDRLDGASDAEAGFAQGRDAGSELLLLGSRVYDPVAARFLAPDPIFQLVNQYAYADGNPVWYWDPDGRSPKVAMAVAAGVGIAAVCVGAVIASPALTIFAGAFVIGLAIEPNLIASASAGAGFGALRAAEAFPIVRAALSGFVAGQGFRAAVEGALGDGSVAPVDTSKPFPPKTKKEVDVRIEPAAAGGAAGLAAGGVGRPSGCSPSSLSAVPAPVSFRGTAVLLSVQAILGVLVVRRRRCQVH